MNLRWTLNSLFNQRICAENLTCLMRSHFHAPKVRYPKTTMFANLFRNVEQILLQPAHRTSTPRKYAMRKEQHVCELPQKCWTNSSTPKNSYVWGKTCFHAPKVRFPKRDTFPVYCHTFVNTCQFFNIHTHLRYNGPKVRRTQCKLFSCKLVWKHRPKLTVIDYFLVWI